MKFRLFTFFFLIGSMLIAQETAMSVFSKYYQAIGGQSTINQVQNIYSFADCSGPNGKYQTEVYSAVGMKTLFRQIRENTPDYVGIVNGETYWTKGTDLGISNKKFASMWRSHELQWMATHLMERFREVRFEGVEEFAGKPAFKLSAIDEVNKSAYLYFDENSYLFRGFTILNPFTENPELIHMVVNKWEKVDGILLPSNVSFSDKNGEYLLNFHTIKINQIDTSIFNIPEKISATKKLLELHELQRKAHFNRDAKLLVSIIADDYTEINKGKISFPKKVDLVERFQSYFDAVTFIEWDDINAPIIKISDDATMAQIHVNKRVRLKANEQEEQTSVFAWTSTFQKIDNNWLMTSMTSTKL